jgi:UDP-N-acetylmuramoylalanine--D-glutamate ligase
LVLGLGVTGAAIVAALRDRGLTPTVVDDAPTDGARARARSLGIELIAGPDRAALAQLVGDATSLLPSPGVPESHPVFALAAEHRLPTHSEFDLAAVWDQRPLLAVTGTDGKTTVTTLVTAMLRASGVHAVDAGNTEVPLVAAIDDPTIEVFVVEASSFRLAISDRFAPHVATWLNFAADHLDAHTDLAAYEAAKARIFANLTPDDIAIVNADDPVVMARAAGVTRRETFGMRDPADWRFDGQRLLTPNGDVIVAAEELWRALPHDISNTLAAAATAMAGGAQLDGIRSAARAFTGLPHRISLVGEAAGVRWYDDSKSTVPHATLAAVEGFESVVLIAGGRNKGIDLAPLATAAPKLRAVVGIGDAAGEIEAAFAGVKPVAVADSMNDAVAVAHRFAQPGDVVLLSPACASFDWYRSYAERGDDFARAVRELIGRTP